MVAPRVRPNLAAEMTGITVKAIQWKLEDGKWLEKREYFRDREGHIWVDVAAVLAWIEGK